MTLASIRRGYHVIKTLGWLNYAPAYEIFLEGLHRTEPQFQKSRTAAAIALGELGDTQAIPDLHKCLESEIWDLKYAALMALSALGDKKGANTVNRWREAYLRDWQKRMDRIIMRKP